VEGLLSEWGEVPATFVDVGARRVTPLAGVWEFAEWPVGNPLESKHLDELAWRSADVPGTVAGGMHASGTLNDNAVAELDGRDFLYRRQFRHSGSAKNEVLVFDGLATIVDVWLNGRCILSARNMFRQHAVRIGTLLIEENELLLHFRAMAPELTRRRATPRWTTRLVASRNLRFIRTTLLGRISGWTDLPAVGPWRGLRIVEPGAIELQHIRLAPTIEGNDPVLHIALGGCAASGNVPSVLEVRIDGRLLSLPVAADPDGAFRCEGTLGIEGASPWWPHNLGTPALYPASLVLRLPTQTISLGDFRLGFRRMERCAEAGATHDGFALQVNGRGVFCRGACWTPADVIGLRDDPTETRRVLGLVRDAGMNMIRITGTMVYETESFYELCDELGILVWQDFMFARMDYPEGDAEFTREARCEVEEVLARLHRHPCLAVLCGNSEIEQQAAMMGCEPDAGRTPFFERVLRDIAGRWCPEVPYVASSPSGGAMPFHVDSGVAHYFGVGAYLRPMSDARESGVRFASECLAFSNVPESAGLEQVFDGEVPSPYSPRYKRGVPRDSGASWDFADVTDHYLERLFGLDARALRYADTERYLALSRIVPGELMARAFGLWRSEGSACRGGLVWLLRDLRPGAGWGILDSCGRPKAAYWFLKRVCAPRALWFTDEGLNGLRLHVRNDPDEPLSATIQIRLMREDGIEVASGRTPLVLEAGSGRTFSVDRLLGRFTDASWAYRFGPCSYGIGIAELVSGDGTILSSAWHLPSKITHERRDDIGLRAVARPRGEGSCLLRIESRDMALFVRIDARGYMPADNYFHLPPGGAHEVLLRAAPGGALAAAQVTAINGRSFASVRSESGT